jgi:hypothetical protein
MDNDNRELLERSVKRITETGEWLLDKDLLKVGTLVRLYLLH